ncbi:MAG: Endonuclease-8 [Daejeonella sp.]|nr:Endonuclease-8 [Daejeonella sp.]
MPEGPSIVILKDAVQQFTGCRITTATGSTKKFDPDFLIDKRVEDFKSWGKHFLICFSTFSIRIHFLLFGTYRINEHKESTARLSLIFDTGELNFYGCAMELIDKPLDEVYDWSADVMSDSWDADKAIQKLQSKPKMLVCDALLDQNIFSGSGNIIKNEVLYRIRVHPKSTVGALPENKIKELVTEVVVYSFEFLEWKKEFTLKKHWLAHTKKICLRDESPLLKEYLGKTNRRSYFCPICQVLYI